jgi:hypothetical protein
MLLVLLMGWMLAAHAQVKVETQDGLSIALDAQGHVVALTADGKQLPLLDAPGGFFVEDLMRSVPLSHFEGSVEPTDKGVVFRGRIPSLDLELEAIITAQADHISVDGKVRDTTGEDRGLRVGFSVPVDGRGFTWWDDIATSRTIADGQHYAYYGFGWRVEQVSAYPFASITGAGTGLTLAQRVDQPRLFRLFYDSSTGYSLDYELGLSAETAKFPSSASFHFLLYRHEPEWGMRAAAQRYYDIFPEFFQVRAERQGLYCYGIPNDLENPEDFGFCYDLAGFNRPDRGKLQGHGVYLLVHPMGTEAHIRWPQGYDWDTENGRPTLEQMEDIILTQRPEYADGPKWKGLTQRHSLVNFEESRQRVENSAVHDPDGHFYLYPYNETIEFIATSTDPELPSPNMAEGERKYYIERHMAIAAEAGSEIDGVDFDNIVFSAGHARENFRRDHFRYVNHPLIYDATSGKVCIQTGINYYEFVKEISDEMHAQGKLCTGNMVGSPHVQTIYGHLLDKHGGELLFHEPTRNLRAFRTLAYQKPVSHIVMSGTVSAGQEETVMHRWLAFGEFPTITELAFSWNSDFEAGRGLHKRFIPAIQRVAYAGWEPITHARVEGDGLFVERFGNWSDGDLHFTVHNDSDELQTGRLIVDRKSLGIEGDAAWVELLGEEILAATEATTVKLDPHRTKLFHIFPPDRGSLPWWRDSSRLLVEGGGRILEGESSLIRTSVEGSTSGAKTNVTPPPGWKVEVISEQSYRLSASREAIEGKIEISAQLADKTTLKRSVQLTPVPALELAMEELDLTLNVPHPFAVAVRNNGRRSLSAKIGVDLSEKLGAGTARGSAEIPAGETVAVELELKSPANASPGIYPVALNLNGRQQTVELHARKGLLARRLAQPPKLDGMLDEWTEPPTVPKFTRFGGDEPLTQATRAWIGYDQSALYIAIHCAEDRMEQLKAKVKNSDGPVWEDDDLAIFLDPNASRGTYYQFELNPLGTIYDSFNDDVTWASGASIQSRQEKNAWILEIAIPWSGLGAPPRSGSRWGINMGRQEKPSRETSTITSTFKETAIFADLIFE